MTLNELLDVVDYNRESEKERIQICRPDANWDEYDEVVTGSALLCPFGNAKVLELGAIKEDVIRVAIDWTGLFTLGGSKNEKERP